MYKKNYYQTIRCPRTADENAAGSRLLSLQSWVLSSLDKWSHPTKTRGPRDVRPLEIELNWRLFARAYLKYQRPTKFISTACVCVRCGIRTTQANTRFIRTLWRWRRAREGRQYKRSLAKASAALNLDRIYIIYCSVGLFRTRRPTRVALARTVVVFVRNKTRPLPTEAIKYYAVNIHFV